MNSFHLSSTGQYSKINTIISFIILCCAWSKPNIKVWYHFEDLGFKIYITLTKFYDLEKKTKWTRND